MTSAKPTGRHVVIAGGGFAGLGAAFALRRRLNRDDRITVIDPSSHFTFRPSLIAYGLGRPDLHASFALQSALESHGIRFLKCRVQRVEAESKTIQTDQDTMTFDRLVIATGDRPDPQAVRGLAGEFRNSHFILGQDSAEEVRHVIQRLIASPGPIVIGSAQGASYLGAFYELTLGIDMVLRRAGVRESVPMTFVTYEPYLGHLGIGQAAARSKLERIFAQRAIDVRVGAHIDHAGRDEVVLLSGETLPAAAAFLMPPLTGDADIWKSPGGLTDDHGFVPINGRYRHPRIDDVYAAGVAAYFEAPLPNLELSRPPNTGFLSVRMGKNAAANVAASLGCGTASTRPLPRLLDIRVLDLGTEGLLLASRGEHSLRHTAVSLPGASGPFLKLWIDRYLTAQLRTGHVERL